VSTHLRIVAGAFRIVGLLLGIPSIAALGVEAYVAIDLGSLPAPPPDNSDYLDVGTYGLVGLLANAGKAVGTGLGKILGLLSSAAPWVIGALAIASLALALVALLLYITGRGIRRRATWARIVGGVLTTGFVLISLRTLTVLPRDLLILPCLIIALSLYTLWVLLRRYA
jgi:hypothetical protein